MRKYAFPAALVGVGALHLFLVAYFLPPGLVFSSVPLAGIDFEFHAVEISRVTEALGSWGHSWAWDPQLLAGYPEGTVFDCDSKAWELLVFALGAAGVPMGLAFNLYVLLVHLALPPAVYLAARLIDEDRWTALLATAFATLLWHFDTTIHMTWRIGTVSYAAAGYAGLLPLCSAYAFLKDGRSWQLLLLCASLALAHMVHPFVFDGLVLPMGVMYLGAARTLGWRRHAGIAAAVVCTIAANSWWLAVLFDFRGDIVPVATTWQGTLGHLRQDLLGIPGSRNVGAWWGVRSGLMVLFVGMGAAGLARWRIERRGPFLPFAVAIGAMLAAAYLGELVPWLEQTQAYRHIIPAAMFAVIPAASLAVEIARHLAAEPPRGLRRTVAVLGGALLAVFVAREALYFFPSAADVAESPRCDGSVLGPRLECLYTPPEATRFRHSPLPRDFSRIAEMVRLLDPAEGRILVESWDLAEHLAWSTEAQVLGGFPYRNVRHSGAGLQARIQGGLESPGDYQRYLTDYAVRWVVLSLGNPALESVLDRVGTVANVEGGSRCVYRVYRTRIGASFLAGSRGEARASLNRIDVVGTDPDEDVVLRFHYLDGFECAPGCTVRKEPLDGDPVGFIRVPAPHPASFSVVNGY